VDGLVLCATSRNFSGRPRERFMFGMVGGAAPLARISNGRMRDRVAERLITARVPESESLASWMRQEFRRGDPAKIVEAAASLGRYSSHDWIGTVDVPTAVVVTTQDRLVPPHRQQKLADSIPGAFVVPVAGDHGVCVGDPSAFVPALVDACTRVTHRP
jgi:pimeloyl-ACP methyl ester carboxylesterase